MAVGRDADVFRFQVAVEQRSQVAIVQRHFEPVRRFQKIRELGRDADRARGGHRSAGDGVREIFAIDVLHRDVEVIADRAVFVDLRHERAHGGELLLQPRAPLLGFEDLPALAVGPDRHLLQRDVRVGSRVAGEKHHGHAAAPDLAVDVVGPDPVEDARIHRSRPLVAVGDSARRLATNQLFCWI